MANNRKPRILCVDDEPRVLDSLSLHLNRHFEVHTAKSGAEGLDILRTVSDFTVVLSDMRMPQMDGAEFLSRVRKLSPDSVRMLLTGQTDISLATKAINEGQIFRFMTKPCPPDELITSFKIGIEQYRLITAERELLQKTLLGSIKALTDILAIINPVAFSRSTRIKRHTSELAKKVGISNSWQVEAAAMLSQLGYIALPPETVEKIYYGDELTPEEEVMIPGVPKVAAQLIGSIPRLEPVLDILETLDKPLYRDKVDLTKTIPIGARILKIAIDIDSLQAHGRSIQFAIDTLKGRDRRYDPELLTAFSELHGAVEKADEIKELPLKAVKIGMILVDKVCTESGALLVPPGFEVTPSFLQLIKNFDQKILNVVLKVIIKPELKIT